MPTLSTVPPEPLRAWLPHCDTDPLLPRRLPVRRCHLSRKKQVRVDHHRSKGDQGEYPLQFRQTIPGRHQDVPNQSFGQRILAFRMIVIAS